MQALIVTTVDQWAAALGATDPATLARLMCDAGLQRVVLAPDGRVLNVGRTTRLATPAQRKASAVRDIGCIIPGCGMPAEWSDVHHVIPWSLGGTTDLDNLVPPCPGHHTAIHAGIWGIVMRDGIPWIRLGSGRRPGRTHNDA